MSTIWFTADLHLDHALVARERGFGDDITAHDDYLAAQWDARVGADDVVKVLGDLCIGHGNDNSMALAWIMARPGIKDLIWGNHDAGHPMHARAHKAQTAYLSAFRSAQQSATMKIARQRVMLSHFPFTGDHTETDRHPEWRPVDAGQWLLHGHTHSTDPGPTGRQIHVGLDAHGLAPVPYRWVTEMIHNG